MRWRLVTVENTETPATPATVEAPTLEDQAAEYFLVELLLIRHLTNEEIRNMHRAKVVYPGNSFVQ